MHWHEHLTMTQEVYHICLSNSCLDIKAQWENFTLRVKQRNVSRKCYHGWNWVNIFHLNNATLVFQFISTRTSQESKLILCLGQSERQIAEHQSILSLNPSRWSSWRVSLEQPWWRWETATLWTVQSLTSTTTSCLDRNWMCGELNLNSLIYKCQTDKIAPGPSEPEQSSF